LRAGERARVKSQGMTDGRWLGLSHRAGLQPAIPPHISDYKDLLAPAPVSPRADLPPSSEAKNEETQQDENFIYHSVGKTDTLMGLSLRYRVPIATLKLVNNLPTENLAALKVVKVPKENARPRAVSLGVVETMDAKIRKFTRTEGCSESEARLYIEDAGGDVDLAVQQYRDDLEEERKAGISVEGVAATVANSSVTVHLAPTAEVKRSMEALSGFPNLSSGDAGTRGSASARAWKKSDREEEGEDESLIGSREPAHISTKALPSPSDEDAGIASGIALTSMNTFLNGGGGGSKAADDGSSAAGIRRRTAGQPHQE
jgi:hypothetical protein